MRSFVVFAGGLVLLLGAPRRVLSGQASRPFTLGADISYLDAPAVRGRAHRTYQENGKADDELSILMRHGWTSFRLRVFVSPVREAPDNSLANTIPLARRIKAAGAPSCWTSITPTRGPIPNTRRSRSPGAASRSIPWRHASNPTAGMSSGL